MYITDREIGRQSGFAEDGRQIAAVVPVVFVGIEDIDLPIGRGSLSQIRERFGRELISLSRSATYTRRVWEISTATSGWRRALMLFVALRY